VCNNNPSISRETQERVRAAMAELGYVPAAADNSPQPIKMIGIVLPPSEHDAYENTFNLKAIRGISLICNQRGVASTVITGRDYKEILRSIRTLHLSGRMDGFILLYSRGNDPVEDYLCEHGLLYVVIGKPSELAKQTICVDNDNLLAARDATDYLYNLGHRNIAYLGVRNDSVYMEERRAGYQLSMMLHNLPVTPDCCVEVEDADFDGISIVEELLDRENRPTAFLVSDDIVALLLERICIRKKLHIPGDISIVSFNNSLITQMAYPRLTAIAINAFQLGQEAAGQVINHILDPELPVTKIVVPHRIIQRESCRRI
jgi:DNA-binding LacI/PurR family transcriptional regulator